MSSFVSTYSLALSLFVVVLSDPFFCLLNILFAHDTVSLGCRVYRVYMNFETLIGFLYMILLDDFTKKWITFREIEK